MTAREALAATIPLLHAASTVPCDIVERGRGLRWGPGADGFALELTFGLFVRPTGTRSVPVVPEVSITSRELARWRRAAGLSPERGIVVAAALGTFSPRAQGTRWDIGGSNRPYEVLDIMATVDEYARPFFDVLRDRRRAPDLLATRLWNLVPTAPVDLAPPPVDLLLSWGRGDLVPAVVDVARGVPGLRRDMRGPHRSDWVELARQHGFLDGVRRS